MWSRLRDDGRARRLTLALAVYVVATGAYFACASRQTLTDHTPFNHFALLAESWLNRRLDLGGPPPGYAQNNDFAEFGGRWFIVFPPFPAVLLLPMVKLGGSAIRVQEHRRRCSSCASRSCGGWASPGVARRSAWW